jgi:hypothetical protein
MRVLSAIVLTILASSIIGGCYYDEVQPADESLPQNVSFANDVEPILVAKCSFTGCHDAVPAHDPTLVAGQAYAGIIEGHYVNTVAPKESILYTMVASGEMPPSGPLSNNEVKTILAWITEGAKNN